MEYLSHWQLWGGGEGVGSKAEQDNMNVGGGEGNIGKDEL